MGGGPEDDREGEEGFVELDRAGFLLRFRLLIALTWFIPPIFGLSFLLFVVEMFTPKQLLGMMLSPPLPLYVVAAQVLADVYFRRFARPISAYLDSPGPETAGPALARAQRFPLDFWSAFLTYLLLAPVAVMSSAYFGTDFRPTSIDWLRIELVSLIVSIIVGLPIFFVTIDLFGRVFGREQLRRPHVTVRMKVFLIAALVPLLIDTMIVQYYWTETGYFTMTTFGVWLVLELLAVAGALLFVRSFGQSLAPLRSVSLDSNVLAGVDTTGLGPQSTDELGVLASSYRELLETLNAHAELLELKNQVLRSASAASRSSELLMHVAATARSALGADDAIVALCEAEGRLRVVAQAETDGADDSKDVVLDRRACEIPHLVCDEGQTLVMLDAERDERAGETFVETLGAKAAIVAPCLGAEGPIGMVACLFHDTRESFDTRDRMLVEGIAAEASTIIQNAELRKRREEAEEKLQHAQRLEGVGQLAGGIAHDFNNILTAILGSADLLRSDFAADDPRAGEAQAIIEQSQRAAALTRQLLAFSRKQMLRPRVLSMQEILSDMNKMLRRLLPDDVVLSVETGDALWPVRADASQLEQVILNLVVNARDAMPDGGEIHVSLRNVWLDADGDESAGEWVELEVADTGSGIAPELMQQIFEPYFTTKEVGKGTGLGLATVHGIVHQSGGRVFAQSDEDGATFKVLLPRVHEAVDERSADDTSPRLRTMAAGMTTLLVEDEPSLRRLIARMLTRAGHEVIEAKDGLEALKVAEERLDEVDLLLCDVVMPGKKGPDIANALRERRPGLPVLLMTGYADSHVVEAAADAGYRILSKPFGREDLDSNIRAALAAAKKPQVETG